MRKLARRTWTPRTNAIVVSKAISGHTHMTTATAQTPLANEFNYFLSHQEELVKQFNGRVLVIRDQKVVGDYGSVKEAYFASVAKYDLGTFLIQQCAPGPECYTQHFSSRVIFALDNDNKTD